VIYHHIWCSSGCERGSLNASRTISVNVSGRLSGSRRISGGTASSIFHGESVLLNDRCPAERSRVLNIGFTTGKRWHRVPASVTERPLVGLLIFCRRSSATARGPAHHFPLQSSLVVFKSHSDAFQPVSRAVCYIYRAQTFCDLLFYSDVPVVASPLTSAPHR
jgi:hypothetical protein